MDWRTLIPNYNEMSEYGIKQTGWQRYDVITQHSEKNLLSMLTPYEISYLYYLTKHVYKGDGEIVDLGPYYGLSTYALAAGLKQNSVLDKSKRIYSFDLFLSKNYEHYALKENNTGSVFEEYMEVVNGYRDYIHVSPGNLLDMYWEGKPIEILFIDIAKSWELNDHIVRNYFPSLSLGSTVIQQDYVYFGEYWIQILMEVLSEYFTLEEYIFSASAVFKTIKLLPDSMKTFNLRNKYTDKQMIEIHSDIIKKSPPYVAEVLKCAHAKMLFDFGYVEECREYANTINIEKLTDDYIVDFHEIAFSNKQTIEDLLQTAQ